MLYQFTATQDIYYSILVVILPSLLVSTAFSKYVYMSPRIIDNIQLQVIDKSDQYVWVEHINQATHRSFLDTELFTEVVKLYSKSRNVFFRQMWDEMSTVFFSDTKNAIYSVLKQISLKYLHASTHLLKGNHVISRILHIDPRSYSGYRSSRQKLEGKQCTMV